MPLPVFLCKNHLRGGSYLWDDDPLKLAIWDFHKAIPMHYLNKILNNVGITLGGWFGGEIDFNCGKGLERMHQGKKKEYSHVVELNVNEQKCLCGFGNERENEILINQTMLTNVSQTI